jgi:hypothetical protein
MSSMTRKQQLTILDLFIREAIRRAKAGRQEGSEVRNLINVLKETGFVLVVTEPGTSVEDEAIGGD